ncbi:hypothetical protein Emed_000430 [Eimeria media]
MRALIGFSLPLVGTYTAANAFTLQSPPALHAGDIKLFGGGAARLAGDIKQGMMMMGSDSADFNDEEGFDQDLLPTDHEADILSGVQTPQDEMPSSLLEMDADQEEDQEEEEEYEGEDEDNESEGLSFFEENDEETEEETPASFIEGGETAEYEADGASYDPWGHDEEEEEEEEENEAAAAAADPYGDSEIPEASFIESDEETDEEMEADEEQEEEEPSFLEEEETAAEEDESNGLSFIQLESKKTVVRGAAQHPRSSVMQAPLTPHDFADQTSAENEMLSEAGESPMEYGEGESGRAMSEPSGADAMGGEAGESEESASAGAGGMEEAEGEGEAPSAAEEQSDEIYGGPADPMIRYGGRGEEDVETGRGAPSEEGLAEEGPSDEETAGGEESLQQRAEETGEEKGNAVPPTTEEELAADLQGAFPRLHASKPHVVQRRHVDQDIRMTEALRTESKAGASGASAPLSLLTVAVTTGVLMLLFH